MLEVEQAIRAPSAEDSRGSYLPRQVRSIGRPARRWGERREAGGQPPATAGTMATVVPSGTSVEMPSMKRTSSSSTNTFTNRLRPP